MPSSAGSYLCSLPCLVVDTDVDLDGDLDEGDGDWLDDRDEVQREEDRKAGLQHYLRLGQWQEAEKLVATEDEYDDLQYLKARELREHQGGI